MIRRRQFLGSMAFWATAGTALPCLSASVLAQPLERLNWTSDVINMEPHDSGNRAPVVTDISLQPGGQQLAVVGDDHFICIYDFASANFVQNLDKHSDWIRCSRYSPDGSILVTAGNDRRLVFWNAQDYSESPAVCRHDYAIIGIDFSNDSQMLATVGFDKLIRIYDVPSRALKREIVDPGSDNHAVGFSVDRRWVAVGGRTGSIQVWNVANGDLVATYRAHRRRVRSLVFNTDGKIVSCGEDQIVAITDPLNPQRPDLFPRQSAKIYDVSLLEGGLIATAGTDNHVNIWRLADKDHIGFLKGHTGTVSCLDSDRTKIVSGGFDTQVRVWQIKKDFVASLPNEDPALDRSRKIK